MLWEDQFDGRDQVGLERGGVETLQVGSREGGREGELGRKAVPRSARAGGTLVGSQVQRSARM